VDDEVLAMMAVMSMARLFAVLADSDVDADHPDDWLIGGILDWALGAP